MIAGSQAMRVAAAGPKAIVSWSRLASVKKLLHPPEPPARWSAAMDKVSGRWPVTGCPPMLVTVQIVSRIAGAGGWGAGGSTAWGEKLTVIWTGWALADTGAGMGLRKRMRPALLISAMRPWL